MIIFRYILGTIRALLLLLLMAIMLFLYFISIPIFGNKPERAFRLRRNYIKGVFIIMNIRFELKGLENRPDAPALYISNHRSFSDPFYLCRYIDAYVIAKAELGDIPLVSQGIRTTGIIFVKREVQSSRSATRQAMVDIVNHGYNVAVYPEGKTSDEQTTLPFKPGTFEEAVELDIPVVPVVLEYMHSRALWVEGGIGTQFYRQFGYWSNPAKMSILPPMKGTNGIDLMNKVRDCVNTEITNMHQGWSLAFPTPQE